MIEATPATLSLLGAVLAASLSGSVHCVGMCGGLAAAACGGGACGGPGPAGAARGLAGPADPGSSIPGHARGLPGEATATGPAMAPHMAYHGGRGLAYASLGALAGGLGGLVDLAGAAAGISRVAALLAGAALVLAGTRALLEARGVAVPIPGSKGGGLLGIRRSLPGAGAPALASRVLGAALERPATQRAAILGVATGLLPCGWLWAFLATAAGAGGALAGAAVMIAFFAGTVPLLAAGGAGAAALARRLGRHAPTLTALALIAAGAAGIAGRVSAPAPVVDRPPVVDRAAVVPRDPSASCCGHGVSEGGAP